MHKIEKMSEAEVILGLCRYLINNDYVEGKVQVSLDGMHKKVYPEWKKVIDEEFSGKVEEENNPGNGDLFAKFNQAMHEKLNKKRLFVECKKGSFSNMSNSAEYKLLREAIGQIATIEKYDPETIYAIAVPKSQRTTSLAKKWIESDGIKALGIRILLINQQNEVWGLFDKNYE